MTQTIIPATGLTQEQAQRAFSAQLRKAHSWLVSGTVLTLIWDRSYLDKPRSAGGRLVHTWRGFAYAADGYYASVEVTQDDLLGVTLTDHPR